MEGGGLRGTHRARVFTKSMNPADAYLRVIMGPARSLVRREWRRRAGKVTPLPGHVPSDPVTDSVDVTEKRHTHTTRCSSFQNPDKR